MKSPVIERDGEIRQRIVALNCSSSKSENLDSIVVILVFYSVKRDRAHTPSFVFYLAMFNISFPYRIT